MNRQSSTDVFLLGEMKYQEFHIVSVGNQRVCITVSYGNLIIDEFQYRNIFLLEICHEFIKDQVNDLIEFVRAFCKRNHFTIRNEISYSPILKFIFTSNAAA